MNTRALTQNDIIKYINSKNLVNSQPYMNTLVNFKKLCDQVGYEESIDELCTRFIIGRSTKGAKFVKSVIYDFISKLDDNTQDNTPLTQDTIAKNQEALRQKQELLKIQADQLSQNQAIAKKQAIELENQKIEAQKIEAEKEALRKQELRDARIQARKEGFVSQDIPEYIELFDYSKNIPTKSREYFEQKNEEKMLRICGDLQKHTILSGSAGSGKTELVIKYAHDEKIPVFKMSCSSDVRMDDLIGAKTISNNGDIKFQAGMLLKAVLTANKEGKAIILLDEINTLAEKVQKNINGLADGTGFIDLPFGRIAINKGVQFLIMGTMNLSYSGTNPLNPELKDRFTVINMPKMSKDIKHKIYSKYNVSQKIENQLIQLSELLDTKQKDNILAADVVFSTRSQIAFLELYEELENQKMPDAIKEALNVTLVSKFDDDDEKNQVTKLINYVFD